MRDTVRGAQTVAGRLGLEIIFLNAATQNEIDSAFAAAAAQGAAGLLANDAYFESHRDQIAALGLRYRLATGVYVGRILKGERPADLPVVQPTKFDLIINLKTAKAIGLTIPESILLRGTRSRLTYSCANKGSTPRHPRARRCFR